MNSHEVSDEEIAREVRTLRNLRRRSGSSQGPGALPLDPDLPPPSPSSSSGSGSGSSSQPQPYSSNDDVTLASPDGLEGDAAGLFWVPAHLHPELAPGEFRAFLKAHTHSDPQDTDALQPGEAPGLARSPSWLARNGSRNSGALGRKKSMLSRQYNPAAGDKIEEEFPPVPNRQRASIYGGRSGEKGLTLHDLQKLEELVDEAGEDNDPEHMRSLLRRSLSMNVAPGFLQDDIPADGEGHDMSTPPSRPGSILRRSARTKIRKTTLQGDGGGHRFAATRKGRMTAAPVIDIPGLTDDDDGAARHRTGSDESEDVKESSLDSHEEYHDARQYDDSQESNHIENMSRRPSDGSTDENHIFDAYARESRSSSVSGDSSSRSESPSPEEESPQALKLALPSISRSTSGGQDWFGDGEKTPTQESVVDPLRGVRRPSPSEDMGDRPAASHFPGLPSLTIPGEGPLRGPTSPTTSQSPSRQGQDLPAGMAPPLQRSSLPPGMAQQQQNLQTLKEPIALPSTAALSRTDSAASSVSSSSKDKEKEKKGGFFSKKDKDKEKKSKKEKDGLFGSLFGGNKKKTEEPSSVANFSSAGPAAAAALLGTSKSAKSIGLSPSPSPTSPGFNSFARYPIHVERAVYRLSHIKLANARRPLYEQVLISNLMFWYLGVIGRNVAEEKKEEEKSNKEKEKEKTPPAKGTPPKPIDVGSAGQPLPREKVESVPPPREAAQNVAPSGKRLGLTKPDRSRATRDAEAAVRTPQYGIQNAQVDSEIRTMKGPRPPSSQLDRGPPPTFTQPPASYHQQQPLQHPPPQQQQQRALSTPPAPHRALSPPAPGGPRPSSDHAPSGPRDPRDGRAGPSAPPYSSAPNGMTPSQSLGDMRDVRQRTHSNPIPPPSHSPYPHSGPSPQPRPSDANMRRVVSEARPSQMYPAARPPEGHRSPPPQQPHSPHGTQPGQIFHHPSSPSAANFNRPPPSLGPGPPGPGRGYPPPGGQFGTQPGQVFRPPPNAHPGPRPQWEPPARLPPGAGTPGEYSQHQVPPHLRRPPPNGPQGFDPRGQQGYPARPQPGGPYPYQGRPPQLGAPAGPQPGQVFPYGGGPPPPQRQGSADDVYRRAQAVPQAYGHHR